VEVRAIVHPSRQDDVVSRFRELMMRPAPDGLVSTQLLQTGAQWRILLWWQEQETSGALRETPQVTAAVELFRALHAEPTVSVLEVRHSRDR
jgi:hypothetical protein